MGIREGSASPNLVVSYVERPCPFWIGVALLCLVLLVLGGGCSGTVSGASVSPVPAGPSITTQPANHTVTAGHTVTFAVTATGTASLRYQWKKNNVTIQGATSSTYTTPPAASSDNGAQFLVVVSSTVGSVTSRTAKLSVNAAAVPPRITLQPASQTGTEGHSVTFAVTAIGTAPLRYQWKKNNVTIQGATSSSYTTPPTAGSDNSAKFLVVVSNTVGNVTSSAAMLTLSAPTSPLRVITSQLPDGTVAGAYSFACTASGGSKPYTWTLLNDALPTGLTVNAAGIISGTPTKGGTCRFTVLVSDKIHTASASLSINVGKPVPTAVITSPANAATISGRVSVAGNASDTVALTLVQVSVDNGNYANATGTNNWTFSVDTKSLSNGFHTISAKAPDTAGITAISSPITVAVANTGIASDSTVFHCASGHDV